MPYRTINMLLFGCFALFCDQKVRFKTQLQKLKLMSKVWTMSCYVISARCQDYKNASNFDPLFLIESSSTNWPANSPSSSAPIKILALDVLRSKEALAKCLLHFELLEKPYFHPLNLHRCFYHPCCLEVND